MIPWDFPGSPIFGLLFLTPECLFLRLAPMTGNSRGELEGNFRWESRGPPGGLTGEIERSRKVPNLRPHQESGGKAQAGADL